MRAAADLARHQPCVLQHAQCFEAPAKLMMNGVASSPIVSSRFRQMTKHRPPRWIRQGVKNGVEMGLMFNHMV